MIRNYITIALRNLIRNKGYSIINIGGLAIGLACCIAIGLYVWDEYSFDRFHSHHDNIYRVVEQQSQAGSLYDLAVTPGPLAPALKADFAEVRQTCRIGMVWWAGVLQIGEKTVEPEEIFVVDNSFFSLFDFKLILGNPKKALLNPDDIVISEKIATRIFGSGWQQSEKILGQQIQHSNGRVLTLAGVAKDPPANSHIQFDVLLSFRYDELNSKEFLYNWTADNYHTYILIHPEANAEALEKKLFNHIDKHVKRIVKTTLTLQPLSNIYLHSDFDFHTDWSKRSNIIYVKIFLAVGTIVLLIGLFNFINLSTARAMNRAKEVGVRKVIGAIRKQLVTQFLSETLIMTILSVCLALFFLQLFLPLLNDIARKSLTVPFQEPSFQFALLGFTFIVSLLAGIYPAFYLSGFKTAKVLKGFFANRSGQFFRQSLVVSQFTFSVILIIGTLVIYKQLTFLQNKSLGFDKNQLLYLHLKREVRPYTRLMKDELEKETSVAAVATASSNLVDVSTSTEDIRWEGQDPQDKFLVTHINIDPDFLSTTGMRLVAGRNFNAAIPTDTSTAYLINETAAKRMGWTSDEAIGKEITFWTDYKGFVIGVVKDFHFRPMTAAIEPCLFRYWPRQDNSGMFVKIRANQVEQAISVVEKFYKKYDPKTTPYYEFVDQSLKSQYHTQQNTARIVLCFSILAIVVSCLGLFGLATYTAEQRTKEIGVRKVLGASVTSIVNLLSVNFLKLVIIAIAIASPIAWWSMNQWLADFAYKIDIEWWMFVLSGLAAISISLITVSFQSIKAALMNPVKSLRSE
jgi:predicted permease